VTSEELSLLSPISSREMQSFRANYRPLSGSRASWGSIAVLPWDEAIFGFPVADFLIGSGPPSPKEVTQFRQALLDFCRESRSEVVSVRVPASDTTLISSLVKADFVYVDFNLLTTLFSLKTLPLPRAGFILRQADAADHERIVEICTSAFHFGRYHADALFPRELADRRYVHWVRRALGGSDPGDMVFVLGSPGNVSGFMHVTLNDGNADLRLGAVKPKSLLGYWLYAETLRALHVLGARTVSTGISAANVRVLQIYAALGFRFSRPEVILHWHSPNALHLAEAPERKS
jgi:hypothetical protein